VVNGWKTPGCGCPFGVAPLHQRQQISINPLVSRDRDGAPIRLFHAGSVKTYPTRKVLDNVHLFYPDAKIGVLGVNGSQIDPAADHGRPRQGI
jgi:hypothetical protein